MRVPLSTSLALVSCMFTMRLPFTRPRRIIRQVEIMLSTIFCAVPLFMRLEPVTNSGPTMVSMAWWASWDSGVLGLLVMAAVSRP